jgi:hypothetical protein
MTIPLTDTFHGSLPSPVNRARVNKESAMKTNNPQSSIDNVYDSF